MNLWNTFLQNSCWRRADLGLFLFLWILEGRWPPIWKTPIHIYVKTIACLLGVGNVPKLWSSPPALEKSREEQEVGMLKDSSSLTPRAFLLFWLPGTGFGFSRETGKEVKSRILKLSCTLASHYQVKMLLIPSFLYPPIQGSPQFPWVPYCFLINFL